MKHNADSWSYEHLGLFVISLQPQNLGTEVSAIKIYLHAIYRAAS
jgi:hypothetical protein